MVEPKNVSGYYGDQLSILMDDGTRRFAVPNGNGTWIVNGDPGDTPTMKPFSWPFNPDLTVSSEYGPRSGGAGSFHEGIDFGQGGVSEGDSIYCAGAGTLEQAYYHSAFGNLAIVFHGTIDGFDWRTLYAHMQDAAYVRVGTAVIRGHKLSTVGHTGGAYGSHLHWETHKCVKGQGIVWNLNDDGGYRTAIDPRDFMQMFGDSRVLNPNP